MKILTVLISIFLSMILIESSLRVLGLHKNIEYYTSSVYGYYKEKNQTIIKKNNKISLDELGNRNDKKNTFQNSNLFFLGDSVTYGGSAVSDNELFTYLVAKKLKKNYLNISANGWGIPNIINYVDSNNFIKENSTYILVCISDCFTRNLRRREQNFFFGENSKFATFNFFKYIVFQLNDHFLQNPYDHVVDYDRDNSHTIKYSINLLKQFDDRISGANSNLIILYSPYLKDYKYKISDGNPIFKQDIKNQIFKNSKKVNLKIIDISRKLNKNQPDQFRKNYIDKVHLSKEGHSLYADIILKVLNE